MSTKEQILKEIDNALFTDCDSCGKNKSNCEECYIDHVDMKYQDFMKLIYKLSKD